METRPHGGRVNLGAYGNTIQASLSSPGQRPGIINRTASRFEQTTAVLEAKLTKGRWAEVVIYWGPKDGGTVRSAWAHAAVIADAVTEDQVKRVTLKLLAPATRYYCRAYATNATGHAWAPKTGSFVTGDIVRGSPDPHVIHVNPKNKSCPSYSAI